MIDQLQVVAHIRSLLLADGSFSALVGNNVYPLAVDFEVWDADAKAPFVVYSVSESPTELVFGGVSLLNTLQLDVNVYALTYSTMHQIAARIRTVLQTSDTIDTGANEVSPIAFVGDSELFDVSAGMYVKAMTYTLATS